MSGSAICHFCHTRAVPRSIFRDYIVVKGIVEDFLAFISTKKRLRRNYRHLSEYYIPIVFLIHTISIIKFYIINRFFETSELTKRYTQADETAYSRGDQEKSETTSTAYPGNPEVEYQILT